MPWWCLIIVAFIITFLLVGNNFNAFLSGFLGAGLLWMIMAWKVDVETTSIISLKIVELFDVAETNMLVIASGVVGGIAGGFGAVTGNSFRQLFLKKKEKSFYS
ncbi:MAG: hypothetical protein JXR07_05135 [Reichenbachiella sp.]